MKLPLTPWRLVRQPSQQEVALQKRRLERLLREHVSREKAKLIASEFFREGEHHHE